MRLLNMRTVRKERARITQTALAERIGTSQTYISDIENGLPASEKMARRIADGLGVEVADLIEPTVTLPVSEIPPELLVALQRQ